MPLQDDSPYKAVALQLHQDWLGSFAIRASIGQVSALLLLLQLSILSESRLGRIDSHYLSIILPHDVFAVAFASLIALVVLGPLLLCAMTPWRRHAMATRVATAMLYFYGAANTLALVGPMVIVLYFIWTGNFPRA